MRLSKDYLSKVSSDRLAKMQVFKISLGDLLVYVNSVALERLMAECTEEEFKPPTEVLKISRWPQVLYIPVDQGPYYQLIDKPALYKRYIQLGGGNPRLRTVEKFAALSASIARDGYTKYLMAAAKVLLASHNVFILEDGHHRASILYALYGPDHWVDVAVV